MSALAAVCAVAGALAALVGLMACLRSALGLRRAARRIAGHAFMRSASSTARALRGAAASGARFDAARLEFARAAARIHEAAASFVGYAEMVAAIGLSVDAALDLLVPDLRGFASSESGNSEP